MTEEAAAEVDAAPAEEAPRPKALPITMIDLVNWAESEVARVDIWDDLLRREGKCLEAGQARYRELAKRAALVLETFRVNRTAIDQVLREEEARREQVKEKRRAASPSRRSSGANSTSS